MSKTINTSRHGCATNFRKKKNKSDIKKRVAAAISLAFIASHEGHALAQTFDTPPAQAATGSSNAPVKFDVPPSSLFDAVQTLSRQAGIPITILPGVAAETATPGVSGEFSAEQALSRLLAGSGIPFRATNGAIIVGKQSGQDSVEVLRPISVVGTMPMVAMPTENGNSGLSIINQDTIKTIGTGDKDPVRLLRVLPNVNWDNNQFAVSQSGGTGTLSEQDLTPERVSISGGKVYENKFMIDGMNNVSGFNVTSTNEADADNIGVNNPMALFINSDVLKEVAVYDSNVPARYSGFTGGVVDMRTRDPSEKFRGAVGYARESGDWVHYRNEGEEFNTTADKPNFTKNSYDLSVDAPVNDKLRTMFAASRITAEQRRTPTAIYESSDKSATESVRASYLGAVSGDLSDDTKVSAKFLFAPYSQEFTRANMANDRQTTKGDNYSATGEIRHVADTFTANLALGMSQSGFERNAPDTLLTWGRVGSKARLCNSGTTCTEGGFGDITDNQRNLQAKGDIGTTALGIDWGTGFDVDQGSLRRSRDRTTHTYSTSKTQANIVCASDDPACITGEQVLTKRTTYLARDVTVDVLNAGYWAEGSKNVGIHAGPVESLDVRLGLRADYGDYLDNLNWAPRFSTSLNFAERVSLTFGANRYYSTDTLTYALNQSSPSTLSESRNLLANGTTSAWSSPAPKYQFRQADVRTPYSDERTVALNMPLLWGDGRVKALTRRTRDEISQTVTTVGTTVTARTPNNNGWTNYKSVSLEWQKSLEKHAFLINGSWSDTERNTEGYMETGDDEDLTSIYYQGSILKRGQLPMLASNFAQPIVINATWTSKWLEDALTVNVTGKYRFARDEIIDTDKDITINGTKYSVWEKATRQPQTRFDLTASYKIDTWNEQNLELFAYVENVFNARSHTATASAPLERGRSFWFGTRYNF